ncbi:hypothetical protein Bca52824_092394 [Brassica carinata]|uniref:Uncharacterized protein n=1 Tax=Brassica carinata TaxID=52824 RepID=A0A8X7NUN9_BRACI|nr:hypothetical protein Bca52824_092394 [Brassica carinata]
MSSQVSWWVFGVMSVVFILNLEFSVVKGGASEETKIHIVYLGEREHSDPGLVTASHLRMLESLLGSKKDASEFMVHSYRHGFSGFAAHLTDSQVKRISAAGAFVPNVSDNGVGMGTARGGAPKARIAMYKVCWQTEDGSCATADILKAMDNAIADGVDVISISLGRAILIISEIDVNNVFSYGAFHAVSKGITVLMAAGNFGPDAYSVQNIAPWIITVAATSLNRWFHTPLTLGNNVTLLARTPSANPEFQAELIYVDSSKKMTSEAEEKWF